MAEENKDQGEEEQAQSGGGAKKMIIFGVVLLLAVGGSIGGTLFFLSGSGDETEVAQATEPEPTKAIYHSLRPAFIVNFTTDTKARYLQTEISVMSRQPEAIEAVIEHAPLVRAKVLDYLTDQSFPELKTNEGKETLRAGLVEVINSQLSSQNVEGGIESILLTSFVLQ